MAMLLAICPAPLIVLTGKLNPGAAPPLSKSVQIDQRAWLCKLTNSLLTNPVVQFGLQGKPVPASAVSRKGCAARLASVLPAVALLQATIEVVQPIAFSMLA